jgi:hypothetical protein
MVRWQHLHQAELTSQDVARNPRWKHCGTGAVERRKLHRDVLETARLNDDATGNSASRAAKRFALCEGLKAQGSIPWRRRRGAVLRPRG